MDNGKWTMDNGGMDNGKWTMENGQWAFSRWANGAKKTAASGGLTADGKDYMRGWWDSAWG